MSEIIGQWTRPPITISTEAGYCALSQEFTGGIRVIHIEQQNIEKVIERLQQRKEQWSEQR